MPIKSGYAQNPKSWRPPSRRTTASHRWRCAGAGEVVRIRQPVDLCRFSPRGWARDRPKRILLLSDYLEIASRSLKEAWSRPGLEWQRLGHPEPTTPVAAEMGEGRHCCRLRPFNSGGDGLRSSNLRPSTTISFGKLRRRAHRPLLHP